MGLSAKMTSARGPTLRPGQVLRRSVAASPGPKNARAMVAPVRNRPRRVAKKIAARFGILHFRDVPEPFPFVCRTRIGSMVQTPPPARLRLGPDGGLEVYHERRGYDCPRWE